ncbi:MAG TPA: septal ring lytic transglycosylase RlpA family protein [Acetobacteraceae bacterium]|jgi:rare lipoprotein A
MPQNYLIVIAALLVGVLAAPGFAAVPPPDSPAAKAEAKKLDRLPPIAPRGRVWIDHSGRKEAGHASWYGPGFAHHVMANGDRMNPHSDVAASKTLPLGTTATVTNLRNGRSAEVRIEDRGPFVGSRMMDVSPQVATELGLKKHGVAPVVVKPIAVPQPDGQVKLGAGAADATPQQIQQATRTTRALLDKHQAVETASRR